MIRVYVVDCSSLRRALAEFGSRLPAAAGSRGRALAPSRGVRSCGGLLADELRAGPNGRASCEAEPRDPRTQWRFRREAAASEREQRDAPAWPAAPSRARKLSIVGRMSEDETRHEAEDRVVDFAALGDGKARAAVVSGAISKVQVPPNG